jgi:hypothetical protein
LRLATLISRAMAYVYRRQQSDPSYHVAPDKQFAASIRQ